MRWIWEEEQVNESKDFLRRDLEITFDFCPFFS